MAKKFNIVSEFFFEEIEIKDILIYFKENNLVPAKRNKCFGGIVFNKKKYYYTHTDEIILCNNQKQVEYIQSLDSKNVFWLSPFNYEYNENILNLFSKRKIKIELFENKFKNFIKKKI